MFLRCRTGVNRRDAPRVNVLGRGLIPEMTASPGDEAGQQQPSSQYAPYTQYQAAPPPQAYPPQPGYWQQPAGYPPGAYQQAQPATDGLAIASMVLGIVWALWIGSILAVIFGHVALNRIQREGKAGRGMAIAGLVLGYIGVGTLALVIVLNIIAAANHGS
jgi:hypothetical protein